MGASGSVVGPTGAPWILRTFGVVGAERTPCPDRLSKQSQLYAPLPCTDPYAPLLGEEGLALMVAIDEEDARAQKAGQWHKGARVSGLFIRPETIKTALHSMVGRCTRVDD